MEAKRLKGNIVLLALNIKVAFSISLKFIAF